MLRRHAAALVLSAALAGLGAAQDRIQLVSGATFEGTIVEESEGGVILEFSGGGGTVELRRSQIRSIERDSRPEASAGRHLLTLSRFADHVSHHFLYRDGRCAGYRIVELRREARQGVPCYTRTDRLLFCRAPGAPPEVDVLVRESVDAELAPLAFEMRQTSGVSHRAVEGERAERMMRIVERAAGQQTSRTALLPEGVAFTGILLKALAAEGLPEGPPRELDVLDPRAVTFRRLRVEKEVDRVAWRGQVKDVFVFRLRSGNETLEVWLDMAGNLVREELGSTGLVSLRAPQSEVEAYIRGDAGSLEQDLGLEFRSEASGLRLMRPNLSWEVMAGRDEDQSVLSLLRPSLRATADVFELRDLPAGASAEGVALQVFERMERVSSMLQINGPYRGPVGDREGLRFTATCRKGDESLRTMGALLVARERALLFLLAAPDATYADAVPDFDRILESVRVLAPEEPLAPWPFRPE